MGHRHSGRLAHSLLSLARSWEGVAGIIAGTFGGVLKVAGADIPLWAWLLGAVALLFLLAVRLQMQMDDTPHLRKLKRQSFVTFGEIAESISKDDESYSVAEVLDRLHYAVHIGEFKERTGHSRLHITGFDQLYAPTLTRPIFSYEDLNASHANTAEPTAGVIAYERSIFKNALSANPVKSGANPWLVLERADFLRWYRRFRGGKYEQ